MGKKDAVRDMFGKLAPRYDRMNHVFSFNIDKIWRSKALAELPSDAFVLDEACGTADFSIEAVKKGASRVIGIDITPEMIALGKEKIQKNGYGDSIELQIADAEKLPFEEDCFDAVTVAFGVRNYENIDIAIKEMYRVLKPGGKLIILELTVPKQKLMRWVYMFYFKRVMPVIGGWFTEKNSWKYLHRSVLAFPKASQFMAIMQVAGFSKVHVRRFTMGISSLYTGIKE